MFLTALSVLLLEIALTRVFAILMWHHFAYMVVSLALLGFGASGSLLTAFPGAGATPDGRPRAATFASLYGVAVILAFFGVTRIRIDSLEIWNAPANFLGLLLTYAVLSVPFLLAGLAIGGTLTRHPTQVGRLYFVDLLGSAVGGMAAPWLLDTVGSAATVMVSAAVGLGGGAAFAGGGETRRRSVHFALLASGTALVLGFSGGGLGLPALTWPIPFAPHKGAAAMSGGADSERTLPSSTAQVDVFPPVAAPPVIGGQFGDRDSQIVNLRAVTQDGTAPTALHEHAADLQRFPCLDDSQAGSAYVAWRARPERPGDVLVIGAGGGIDVMVALAHGAARVTAVDINRAMIRMVREEYADYLDRLFDDPRVRLVHAEGRAFLRHSGRNFDVIQLSGVDTFTALSTGAYTLSESYLYTVEAVKEFWHHLSDGGIVTWSRFMLSWPKKPRETIRLANIVRQALDELGVAEPWRHVCVLQAHGAASTMVKKTPFTAVEIAALRTFAADENFMGLVFDPLRPRGGPYAAGRTPDYEIRDAVRTAAGLAGELPKEIKDGPVMQRFAAAYEQALRAGLAGDAAAADAALDALPAAFGADPAATASLLGAVKQQRDDFLRWRHHKDLGFAEAQRDFDVLVRGAPAERAAFVGNYVYDLAPATDDQPFFFDYFRLSRFVDYWRNKGTWAAEYHPDFPVGHMVLLSSMAQILLLAVLLILLPLRRLRRRGVATPGRLRTFAYFAALGIGFMFVELGLMQKFILFLGHPTHSLAVVLSSMLAFSGLGALWSSRLRPIDRAAMNRLLAAIAILIALEALAANLVLPALLGLDIEVRVLITVLLIAPLALALGLPFPLGIRLLEARAPALIPWGWAVNGFLSVFSSLLATSLAMQVGFTVVLLLAAGVYVAGLLLAPVAPTGAAAEPARP